MHRFRTPDDAPAYVTRDLGVTWAASRGLPSNLQVIADPIFRSVDEGQNWAQINDNQQQWGLILQIAADPRLYRGVYDGAHGRGTIYGDPR